MIRDAECPRLDRLAIRSRSADFHHGVTGMKFPRFVLLLLAFSAAPASAADSQGNFAMKGAGFLPCQVFVTERESKSNVYYMIGGWLEGFISAHNKYVDGTYDIASFESLELLLWVIDKHCRSNPDDRLYSVVNSIIIQLSPDRLQKRSRKLDIKSGQRSTALYQTTIRRMQARLTELGLYKDDVDGRYTEATESALMAFQSDNDLEMTGFPDQTTLWRLLRQ